MLKVELIPGPLQLLVLENALARDGERWDGNRDDPPPSLRRVRRTATGRVGTPIVSDYHCVLVTFQGLMKCDRLAGQCGALVAPVAGISVGRSRGSWSDGPISPLGQSRQQLMPGPGRVRKAVKAQCERALTGLQIRELQTVG
jgi:hypothetical protein